MVSSDLEFSREIYGTLRMSRVEVESNVMVENKIYDSRKTVTSKAETNNGLFEKQVLKSNRNYYSYNVILVNKGVYKLYVKSLYFFVIRLELHKNIY